MVLLMLLTRGLGLGFFSLKMMLKTQPLCTVANWYPGGRVLSEVAKNSFIASLGRGANASKLCVPTQRDLVRSFYSSGSRMGLLIRIRVCAGSALL